VDLNQLNAQALKAHLRGDTELHKKLMSQIEEAKTAQEKKNNTIVLGSIGITLLLLFLSFSSSNRFPSSFVLKDERGVLKHLREEGKNSDNGKRRKGKKIEEFDKEEGRVRYFADDDVDLKTLVEREKRRGVDDMDLGMANAIVASSKNREMSEEDWDNLDTTSIDNSKKKMTKEKMEALLKQKAIKGNPPPFSSPLSLSLSLSLFPPLLYYLLFSFLFLLSLSLSLSLSHYVLILLNSYYYRCSQVGQVLVLF
jgi:hypothetical protein